MQFEGDDWVQEVKKALKNWHHLMALSQTSLVSLGIVKKQLARKEYPDTAVGAATALRDVLREGINVLGVPEQDFPQEEDDPKWFAYEWRLYSFLTLRYVKGFSRLEVQQRIGLAEGGQYYKVQRDAVAMLATVLRDWEGQPENERSVLSIIYPSGAMKLTDPFYINRQADDNLQQEIQHPGRTITLTGPRQVGKTSMLVRAAQAAVQAQQAKIVYIDLQTISQETLKAQDTFFQELAYVFFDELDLNSDIVESTWESRLSSGRKLTKLIERDVLPNIEAPVILVLDEVDRLLLTDYHADFFGLLRSWHNLRSRRAVWERFGLLMAISTEPYLLINDLQQSPFNVGMMLYLQDFNATQISELNALYEAPVKENELQSLLHLLAGHPYLTRIGLYTMVKDQLSFAQLKDIAVREQSPFIAHLRYQQQMLLSDPELQEGLVRVMKNKQCQNDMVQYRLLKAGLIKSDGHEVICRCDLYHQYFAQVL